MKRFALFVLAIVCVAVTSVVTSSITVPTASAQTPSNSIIVDAASFRPVQTDALTGIAIDPIGLDGSKRPCTRLKMRINRMTREEIGELSFRLRGGVIDLRKCQVAYEGNGLIIEMTAYKNTVFYLQHPRFGMSNEVTISTEGNKEYYIEASLNQLYPITVQSNVPDVEVYIDGALVGRTNAECVLSVADVLPGQHRLKMVYGSSVKEQTVEVHRNSTFFHQKVDAMGVLPQDVIFQVEPATAVVTFDGEILSLDEGGAAFRTKRQGRYSYSVEAQDYHAESGQIVVAGDKVVKRITLRPAFGWLQVSSTTNLSGAKVYVDNRLVGTVPLSERVRLSSGTHALRIVKEKYKAYTSQVTITDNQTSTLTPSLAANFAVVSLTVADGAEIWINNERKGSGSWRGELALGTYRVETRKSGYRASVESLDVATASPINRTLTAPSPIYGSLRIVSQPLMASVKVDGRAVGETPSTLSKVLVGKHTIEITKSGYAPYKKDITITEGQTANLNATLTKAVATSTTRATSTNSTTQNTYKVGDYYKVGGKKGVVFEVTSDGRHGKIVSLKERWSKWEGAKSWCASLGGGWRLPTKEELQTICRVKSTLNSTLAAKGDKLEVDYCYWSSNEYGSSRACNVSVRNGYTYIGSKNGYNYVRAVSAF